MSDADLQFHRAWLGMVQPTEGLVVSIPVLVDAQVAQRRPPEFQDRFRSLLELRPESTPHQPLYRVADTLSFVKSLLEWPDSKMVVGEALPKDLSLYVPEGQQVLAPSFALRRTQPSTAPADTPAATAGREFAALVWEIPEGLPFDKPETKTGPWEYPPAAKFDRLLRQCRVPIGLLSNRHALRLVYAPHGEATGSITFRLDDMSSVGGRLVLDAFVSLLGNFRFFGAAEEHTLPAILEESRKRQINVTEELAGQVFEALEILLAGFEGAAQRDEKYRRLLDAAAQREGDHLYAGLLTVLLRLVFILYAEDRALLPVENSLYSRHLSLLSLFAELQSDFGAFPDSMSRRFGAWPRLLALFRAIFLGCEHDNFRMPQRRGELFDPHLYPFLEGWGPEGGAPITLAEDRAQVSVPTVDDLTVFQVLHRLLMLEGQRLSYRTLDVEQIGSVYEALMGYHVIRATERMVCLKPEKAKLVWVSATELQEVPKAQRAKWLKEEVGLSKALATKLATASSKERELDGTMARLLDFGLVGKATAEPGRLLIQPGSERRKSSSHYTPRSLSAPIVARTLEPLIRVMGDAPASERLLNLKVCDPAMGSGAFLVEACRYLGDQLVAAWTREGRLDKIADQHDDVVNHARRLVAQRCLYGVDKNRFAVNLAKLSLWLVTLAKDEPFTFVDHALRHGDSLVGLDFEQIKSFHWKPKAQLELCRGALENALGEAIALRQKILDLAAEGDVGSTREKYRLLQDAEDALKPARLIGDLVVGAFFSSDKDKDREKERHRRLQLVESWLASGDSPPEELLEMQRAIHEQLPVFHWMTEYPEVFHAERPDPLDENQINRAAQMDAFIGNPPFAGKNAIAEIGVGRLLPWLQEIHENSHGNADYSAHFFRRSHALIGANGTIGLIATNTIAQGDTRATGLQPLVDSGAAIYDATSNMPWPGEAAVTVSVVHLGVGSVVGGIGQRLLDGLPVKEVSSQLRAGAERHDPVTLRANENASFQGSIVLGMGFTLTPEERDVLIRKNKKNAERIFPYIGGEEVNTSPTQSFHRYVINFEQMSLEEAERWPDLISILREKVKPDRDRNNRDNYRLRWWQFGELRPGLYAAIRPLKRCLVTARVTKHLVFSFQPTDRVLNEKIYVFPFDEFSPFSTMQCRVHDAWAWRFSSTIRNAGLNYSGSDCFDTFPFPEANPKTVIPALESIGEKLYTARAQYLVENDVGLTIAYNRMKDPDCDEPAIKALRDLHIEMDQAVLKSYGWSDIQVPDFTTPVTPAEKSALEAHKNEIIDRLFDLNAKRASEEAKMGTGSSSARKSKKKTGKQLEMSMSGESSDE